MRPGLRILITRSASDSVSWMTELRQRGAEVLSLPCVRTEACEAGTIREPLARLQERCTWWWFSSRRGVEAVLAAVALPSRMHYAVVGQATAEALGHAGAEADLVGDSGAIALAERWLASGAAENGAAENEAARPSAGQGPIALLGADRAAPEAGRLLRRAGVEVHRLAVYRTVPRSVGDSGKVAVDVDVVLVASPSAVEGLVQGVELAAGTPLLSIGPTTSAAVRAAGLPLLAEAASPSLAGMMEKLP